MKTNPPLNLRPPGNARPPAVAVGLAALAAAGALVGLPASATAEDEAPPATLSVYAGPAHAAGGAVHLDGPDAARQLVVTAPAPGGGSVPLRDLTRSVSYGAVPEGIVAVGRGGYVTPVADGEATVVVETAGGARSEVRFKVTNAANPRPVNFPNEIVPIFTKLGCNGGGCHGKSEGQNGFRLSLLGFEPAEDYEHLVKEGRGRRLFPASPENSLLLLKALGDLPHGGGGRLEKGSPMYRLIHRWIAQGMPYGRPDDPTVARLEVFPDTRILAKGSTQQLSVLAHYTDGSVHDVTRTVQFESNQKEIAECNVAGLVETAELPGDFAVMVRFQELVGVFQAMVPLGVTVADGDLPPARNFIDELVFAKLKKLGMPPSPVCDDATYLRRTAVDIAGRLPTREEAEAFAADTAPDKRARWVEALLAGTDYADNFANKWSAILRNKRKDDRYQHGTYAFHSWIRQSLHENVPFDQIAGEVVAASGEIGRNPAVGWYRSVRKPEEQLEDAAQVFLATRLQCARCHHHPFEKWSQQDYYGFAAFFSRVGRKGGERPGEEIIYHRRGNAVATNLKTKQPVKPTPLGAEELSLPPDRDPRRELADWLGHSDNPFFARSLTNRYWKHFFSRGLVEPEDDMRVTNPPTNPALLDALARHFVDSGFDLKDLVRTICNSQTYQLSALPNEHNADDRQNYSRFYPKRFQAEILLDAIDGLLGSSTKFPGQPAGTRAIQLPDDSFTKSSYFLAVFGRPEMDSACECERTQEANLAQSLHLLNSKGIHEKLTNGGGSAAKHANNTERPHADKLREVFYTAFSRPPAPEEVAFAQGHIEAKLKAAEEKKADAAQARREAYEDLLWVLINTKEFLFNH